MFFVWRKKGESLVIGGDIIVTVIEIRGDKARLGIDFPPEVPVHRKEVFDAMRRAEPQEGHGEGGRERRPAS